MTAKKPTIDSVIDAFAGAHREIELIWSILREMNPRSAIAEQVAWNLEIAYASASRAARWFKTGSPGWQESLESVQRYRHESQELGRKYTAAKAKREARKVKP